MKLPEDMPPEMMTYRMFANLYGWTPDQVDELTLAQQEWLPRIEHAASEAAKIRQKAQKRQGKGGV